MTVEEFLRNLKLVSVDNGVLSVLNDLESPSVRDEQDPDSFLSGEFNKLDAYAKKVCRDVAMECSTQTLYNVLLVLDGLLAISSEDKKPKLELFIDNSLMRIRVNDPEDTPLSSTFKDII